ncbi:hypothetical protein Fcan01_02086 [Folsomia candida]|uniref:Uncharacterized protein n=1 Tax=Folsomia candida TaxID=158441 RepID=A0A226EZS4_FOLCA|nr:hypothetical protein Fcan01_02086 [Folsomia candida]
MGDKENPKTTAAGKAESKWTATPQSHKSPIYAHTSPTRTPSPGMGASGVFGAALSLQLGVSVLLRLTLTLGGEVGVGAVFPVSSFSLALQNTWNHTSRNFASTLWGGGVDLREMHPPVFRICFSASDERLRKLEEPIMRDPRLKLSYLADEMGVPKPAICSMLTEDLGMKMDSVRWDIKGPLLIKFIAGNTTINGAAYADDNAPPHTWLFARDSADENRFTCTNHTLCSSDLTLSDYYSFRNFKKDIRGKRFSDDSDMKSNQTPCGRLQLLPVISSSNIVSTIYHFLRQSGIPWILFVLCFFFVVSCPLENLATRDKPVGFVVLSLVILVEDHLEAGTVAKAVGLPVVEVADSGEDAAFLEEVVSEEVVVASPKKKNGNAHVVKNEVIMQKSQKKNAAALQKHADEAVAVASKAAATAAATTSSSATSDTTFPAVFKAPFAGWKPGFIMPAPPTHNNDVNMG